MSTKKELREAYKRREPRMGVFQIRNLINGKIFVGRATDLENIWSGQQFKLDLDGHPNPLLNAEWNEFGAASFVFEILHELSPSADPGYNPRAELAELESLTIEDLQPYESKGYHKRR